MSVLDGPGEGTWSVFAQKVVEERDRAREELAEVRAELDALRFPRSYLPPGDERRDALLVLAQQQVKQLRAALQERGCRPIANGNDCAGCKALSATEEKNV